MSPGLFLCRKIGERGCHGHSPGLYIYWYLLAEKPCRKRERERGWRPKRAKISGQSFYYPGREPIVFILDTRLETINAWARLLAPILTIISHAGLTVLHLSHAVKKLTRDCRMWLACASIVEHGPGDARWTTRANREGDRQGCWLLSFV